MTRQITTQQKNQIHIGRIGKIQAVCSADREQQQATKGLAKLGQT